MNPLPPSHALLLIVIAIGLVIGLCKEKHKHDAEARVDTMDDPRDRTTQGRSM